MSSSVSPPQPTPTPVTLRPAWDFTTGASPRGLALAREKGGVLVWDDKNWLYLLDRAGRPQAQVPSPRPLAAVCCADDGSSYAAVGSDGEVWWLAPDLIPRWQRNLPHRGVTAAM